MGDPLTDYLVRTLLPWGFKTIVYLVIFRVRTIHATALSTILIAGLPATIVQLFPLPGILILVLTIGFAMYLCSRFTDADAFPDAFFIVTGNEVLSPIFLDLFVLPLIYG